ncbi:hypothetical protein [Phycicoccus flavus]|uniref:hypothetical protein n=1 Tax=Phycicoccus flavus TaxID=2502783 RepID=UPI000FEB7668|nr:hypothetical protein [Phycicoccus flavus]NHA67473.1 hypothetical protein [Phycicoccus flavus]
MSEGLMGTDHLVRAYLAAKREVVDGGFCDEIAWQLRTGQAQITPQGFFREAAWVVLNAGMREAVVRQRFPKLSVALHEFVPNAVVGDLSASRAAALELFRHERKIDAILGIAEIASRLDEDSLERLLLDPEPFLCGLPYVGPVTWRHLAKNLGVQVAKADRHLVRIAESMRRSSVDAMCNEISEWLGEPVPVVDVVLWRWSVMHGVCGVGCLAPEGLCHRAKSRRCERMLATA